MVLIISCFNGNASGPVVGAPSVHSADLGSSTPGLRKEKCWVASSPMSLDRNIGAARSIGTGLQPGSARSDVISMARLRLKTRARMSMTSIGPQLRLQGKMRVALHWLHSYTPEVQVCSLITPSQYHQSSPPVAVPVRHAKYLSARHYF